MIRTNLRSKSKVMKTYDKESSVYYSKRFSSEGGRHIDFTEKRLLARYVKRTSLLEIGTASGRFVGFVERMGWDYTGIDISAQMLRLSKNNGCKLVQGDAEELPITKFLKQLDSSGHWPSWFATLGFAIGRKDYLEAGPLA